MTDDPGAATRIEPVRLDAEVLHTAVIHAAVGGYQTVVYEFFNVRPLLLKRINFLYKNITGHVAPTSNTIFIQHWDKPIPEALRLLNNPAGGPSMNTLYNDMRNVLTLQALNYDARALRGGFTWEPAQPVYVPPGNYGWVIWMIDTDVGDIINTRLEYVELDIR